MSAPADVGEPDASILVVAHLLRALDVDEQRVAGLSELEAIDTSLSERARPPAAPDLLASWCCAPRAGAFRCWKPSRSRTHLLQAHHRRSHSRVAAVPGS